MMALGTNDEILYGEIMAEARGRGSKKTPKINGAIYGQCNPNCFHQHPSAS